MARIGLYHGGKSQKAKGARQPGRGGRVWGLGEYSLLDPRGTDHGEDALPVDAVDVGHQQLLQCGSWTVGRQNVRADTAKEFDSFHGLAVAAAA